jgi:hypothetical protein
MVLGQLDPMVGIGIRVAAEPGMPTIPLHALGCEHQSKLVSGKIVRIEADGRIMRAQPLGPQNLVDN